MRMQLQHRGGADGGDRALDQFPDGQMYANLRVFDDDAEPLSPEVVLRTFLDGLERG